MEFLSCFARTPPESDDRRSMSRVHESWKVGGGSKWGFGHGGDGLHGIQPNPSRPKSLAVSVCFVVHFDHGYRSAEDRFAARRVVCRPAMKSNFAS